MQRCSVWMRKQPYRLWIGCFRFFRSRLVVRNDMALNTTATERYLCGSEIQDGAGGRKDNAATPQI